MTIHPHVAVVILNWNGSHFLAKFLPSVMAGSYSNFSVVVIDNGSTDDSVDFLAANCPSVRIIHLNENLGFTGGYNVGLKEVEADYYVLLNSDVEVEKDWLEPMVNLAESDKTIAVCQPKLLSFAEKDRFEYAGAAGGWLDQWGYPFSMGRIFEVCEIDKGQYDQSRPVFWASGAAFFVKSSVFWEAGAFDPYFFAHQEEIDLCWRIQLLGYKVYSCPQSVVYHVGGGTLPKGSRKTFLNFRNNLIMLSKNLPFSRKLLVFPVRFVLDMATVLKGLLGGETAFGAAIIKAYLAFISWSFSGRKKSVFPRLRKSALSGYHRGSVAWQHFINKKNSFLEIVPKSD